MTSFDVLASSTEDSEPIELFEFAIGTETFYVTSYEQDVLYNSNTYVKESISRDAVAQGIDDRQRVVTFTVPITNAFAQKYKFSAPGLTATAKIIRIERSEAPVIGALQFLGFVDSVDFPGDGSEAIIATKSLEAFSSRPIPRFTFQGQCNHVVYDAGCGVDPVVEGHKLSGANVTAVSGRTITVAGLNASGRNYVSGICFSSLTNDFRMVVAQSGDDITFLLPFTQDVTGTNVDVFRGCDRDVFGDCGAIFDNVLRFGGFAFVPGRNIFQTGLN